MTTWDMETVHKVQRLGVKMRVSRHATIANPDWRDLVRGRAARELAHEARVFAVEVHPDDVRGVEVERREAQHDVLINAQWRPFWRTPYQAEVELRGGHMDGETMTVQQRLLDDGVNLLEPPGAVEFVGFDQAPEIMADRRVIERYVLAGWREEERRWVMAIEG